MDRPVKPVWPPRPRSVYVAFEAFPRPKGASSHIAAMITALSETHAPVLLLCCGYADMPARQYEEGVTIARFKVHHPNLLERAAEFGDFVYETLRELPVRPELLMFRDPWGGWPALSALPDVPSVFEVNGLPTWELTYNFPAVAGNTALLAKIEDVERFCLDAADRIVTVSDLTKQALAGLGVEPDKISVVPNSASDTFFQSGQKPSQVEALSQGRWFGYFGSLHPWQGVHVLVDAWARIADEWPDVNLAIVHNGRRQPLKKLKRWIRKKGLTGRVFLQSPLPPERLAAAISRLEFTTAPLTETLRNTVQGCCPIKIVESMAVGVPVLASRLRVTLPLIEHNRDGYLVRPGDTRAWARAIRTMLGDENLCRQLADRAKVTANRRFTRRYMFDTLKQVLDEAVLCRSG